MRGKLISLTLIKRYFNQIINGYISWGEKTHVVCITVLLYLRRKLIPAHITHVRVALDFKPNISDSWFSLSLIHTTIK